MKQAISTFLISLAACQHQNKDGATLKSGTLELPEEVISITIGPHTELYIALTLDGGRMKGDTGAHTLPPSLTELRAKV